ncbi:hypothetical protein GALL_255500 [mine drainage metagenome]|uniref:Uncharacterized protein n=1 Tax=mine drainage metagenome TaxID=410659 RepID=A0A1J5RWI0_9ZZZZ
MGAIGSRLCSVGNGDLGRRLGGNLGRGVGGSLGGQGTLGAGTLGSLGGDGRFGGGIGSRLQGGIGGGMVGGGDGRFGGGIGNRLGGVGGGKLGLGRIEHLRIEQQTALPAHLGVRTVGQLDLNRAGGPGLDDVVGKDLVARLQRAGAAAGVDDGDGA